MRNTSRATGKLVAARPAASSEREFRFRAVTASGTMNPAQKGAKSGRTTTPRPTSSDVASSRRRVGLTRSTSATTAQKVPPSQAMLNPVSSPPVAKSQHTVTAK
jgi:hypothetical protein